MSSIAKSVIKRRQYYEIFGQGLLFSKEHVEDLNLEAQSHIPSVQHYLNPTQGKA